MIVDDEQWEKLVPNSVSEIIKKINGVKRIKTIFQSDTKPQEY